MNICIVTPEIGPFQGGIATFYNNLIPILATAGHNVMVLTVDRLCEMEEEDRIVEHCNYVEITLRRTYYDCYKIYKQKSSKDALYVASEIAFAQSSRIWLEENCGKYKIDIIETIDANGTGYFLASEKLPPVVICGHGALFQLSRYDFTLNDKRSRIITKLELEALKNADLIITHSFLNQSDLSNSLNATVQFAAPPLPKNLEVDKIKKDSNICHRFLVVGRLQAFKGIKIMAEVLKASRKLNVDLTVLWIGSDTYTAPFGSLWTKFLKRNYKSIWEKSLVWSDAIPRENLSQILASSRIVIIPSLWETFSYAALEAALANKQIIITEKTGASFLLRNYVNCKIIPAGDSQALLESIMYFMKHSPEEDQDKYTIPDVVSDNNVLKNRIESYKAAINVRRNRVVSDYYNPFVLSQIDLRLPVFFYFKKYLLKLLSILRINQGR